MHNETGNCYPGNGSYGNSINSFITCIIKTGTSHEHKTRNFEKEDKILLQVLLVHHVLRYGSLMAGMAGKKSFSFILNNLPFYMKNLNHTDDPYLNFFPGAYLNEVIPVHFTDGLVNSPIIIKP